MLILASGSPRRKEILTMLGYSFLVDPADVDESLPEGIAPHDAVAELSRRKALETAARRPDDVVLGSDTVVSVAGEILGKPRDREDAARMLRLLSGCADGRCRSGRHLSSYDRSTDTNLSGNRRAV